jgi:cell division inhibitor SulA
MHLTPNQRLADTLIRPHGLHLPDWIVQQADEQVPAATVARKLDAMTDGQVQVTGQTILNWTKQFRDRQAAA